MAREHAFLIKDKSMLATSQMEDTRVKAPSIGAKITIIKANGRIT